MRYSPGMGIASYGRAAGRSYRRVPVWARSLVVLLLMAVLAPLAVVLAASANDARAGSIVQYVLCSWEDPNDKKAIPVVKTVYEITQTEDLQYQLFSKSAVGASAADPGYDIPSMLAMSDYAKNNLDIVNSGNKTARKYTPYDLYGYAGMNFTNYQGEWNWLKVYYCTSDNKGTGEDKAPEDLKLNLYYQNRKRPLDNWASRAASQDPRVRQRTNNLYASNMSLDIANTMFWVTKLVTAFCTSLMALSFSNIVDKMGLIGAMKPIMTNLFSGLFWPLMFIMMAMTAVTLISMGLIKRQYRQALGAFIKALACMAGGIFISMYPMLFLSLPNDVGLLGQYLVMSGLNNTVNVSGDDFCSTDTTEGGFKSVSLDVMRNGRIDDEAITNALSSAADASSRAMTCSYWKLFALTPYSLAQYGSSYDTLYAKGKAPAGSTELGNKNTYPGLAAVPVGNDKTINNWLIYQLSAQNVAHVPSAISDASTGAITKPSKPYSNVDQYARQNKMVNNVYGDWYRTADALSNYDVDGSNNKTKDSAATTNQWTMWIGNAQGQRMMVAMLSILVAVVGTMGPIVMGATVVVAAFACVLIMAFAPLALTFGMWAGRGQEILKGWWQLLIESIVKRVVLGLVYMVMLVLDLIIMRGIGGLGDYLKSAIIVSLLSYVIVKNRSVIVRLFTSSVGGSFSATRNRIGATIGKHGHGAVNGVRNVGVGAVGGMRNHLGSNAFKSAVKGAGIGASRTAKNSLYTSDMGRKILQAEQITKNQNEKARRRKEGLSDDDDNTDNGTYEYFQCESCANMVTAADYTDVYGHIVCNDCYDSGAWRSVPGADRWGRP